MTYAETRRWSALQPAAPRASTSALHALQRSLWEVGGLMARHGRGIEGIGHSCVRQPASEPGQARRVALASDAARAQIRNARGRSVRARQTAERAKLVRSGARVAPSRLAPSALDQEGQQKRSLGPRTHVPPALGPSDRGRSLAVSALLRVLGQRRHFTFRKLRDLIGASPVRVCFNVCDSHAAVRPRRRIGSRLVTDREGPLAAEVSSDFVAVLGHEDVGQGPLKSWSAT